jgi:hypothetical protein
VIDRNGVELNAEPSTNARFRGSSIDSSDESRNASDSIRFSDDGDSNTIDEIALHSLKLYRQRISTLHGMTIDSSVEHEKVDESIRFNDDWDSNESEKSDLQSAKHNVENVLIDFGIIT